MIMIETEAKKKRILEYMRAFKAKQDEMETMDLLIYSCIPLGIAAKYNLVFTEFMLHPMVLKKRKFYEPVVFVKKKGELVALIAQVLQFEFMCEPHESKMSSDVFKKVAKVHTRLTKPRKKKVNAE